MQHLLRTPLFDWHCEASARISDFGGWEMPIQYTTVIQEHEAVRNHVGITDVSHMGRLFFRGPGARDFLDRVLTRNVATLKLGRIRYSLLTRQDGGVLDDLLVGCFEERESRDPYYFLVVNAANRESDVAFLRQHLATERDERAGEIVFQDRTFDFGMIAVQGPKSVELLQPFLQTDLASLPYYAGTETSFSMGGRWAFISRTGYTGEDGFEITMEPFLMEQFVGQLFEAGAPLGIRAVGLAARDTLRLEAAMPLYGHELDECTNPFQAGLSMAVDLEGRDFPGAEALRKLQSQPLDRVRIGLEINGKRPAREGHTILSEGQEIGKVTSGTFSPTLQKPIAMGYVPPKFSEPGQSLSVDIRGNIVDAVVVSLPFYRRAKDKKA